ncbi:hypothetical protein HPP92_010191 [Vanilla planifolia]|uniref:sulfiredoxin n=1 Tax=Vanilla planifolia TaxID=51239 RepID=A0A835UZG6_VANPL|nr:hypothetical protein HPP92_010191 [Vanilla planifolia]
MANLHFNLTQTLGGLSSHIARASSNGVPFSNPKPGGPMILDLPLEKIRRPLMRTRANDPEKVKELMESIQQIGLRNLLMCLRSKESTMVSLMSPFEAHQRLGLSTIRCKIRRGTKETLRHHMR